MIMPEPSGIIIEQFGEVWRAYFVGSTGSGPTREDALQALVLDLVNAPKIDAEGRCVTCGHKHVEYCFSLNRSFANLVRRLHAAGGRAEITDIGRTHTEYSNISKLQFWGLVVPYITPENVRKRGWWELTPKGRQFVEGSIAVHKQVVVCGRKFVRFSGPLVMFNKLDPDILLHGDYADQAREGIDPEPDAEEDNPDS